MVKLKYSQLRRRQGYIVFMITIAILTLTLNTVLSLYKNSIAEYDRVKNQADYNKAKFLAQGGLATAINFLNRIPRHFLYAQGFHDVPFPFTFNGLITEPMVFQISEESGKLNPNSLVNFFDDEVNFATRGMLDRLAESLGMPQENWDAVVDWIDENDSKRPYGFESFYYASLEPPRRIKNARLHSLSELLMIEGFDSWVLFADKRTEEEKEMYSTDFYSPEELELVQSSDFKLSNNLSVYLQNTPGPGISKVNINSAPYHVVMSLSEFMQPQIARSILLERNKKGYFKSIDSMKNIPLINQKSVGNLTLLQEIEGRIVFNDRIFKIVITGQVGNQLASVIGIYDISGKKLVRYMD